MGRSWRCFEVSSIDMSPWDDNSSLLCSMLLGLDCRKPSLILTFKQACKKLAILASLTYYNTIDSVGKPVVSFFVLIRFWLTFFGQ